MISTMLLSQSSFLCSPIIKFPLGKCWQTNIPLQKNGRLSHGKMGVLYNGYSYFSSPCHPLQLDLELPQAAGADNNEGIGILQFFQGKNILVTGATGLLGKVLVEKLLRSTPVAKIYLLIKAKDQEDAIQRVTNEIINSELMKCVKEEHGESYQAFVREKLIAVVGNICEPNLGMDSESADTLRKDVHVIIQSAACTTLNARYDSLLDSNVNAPQRLMRFAKTCKNLKLFTHISTAYVNGRKEGVIVEKPLIMGDNARKEAAAQVDVGDEIKMILKSATASSDEYDATKTLKKLGQDRASVLGWYNAYHLTKAMGEMVLSEIRGDVPLLVVRPTVIESSYKQPFPGWIQGNRMFDPVIISYGKGHLPAFYGNPDVVMDVIPVDMVVNTTIAAIAKEGNLDKAQHNVYHVASSVRNPLKFSEFFEYLYEYFNAAPLIETRHPIRKIKFFGDYNEFSEFTREEIWRQKGAVGDDIRKKWKAKVAYSQQLCKMYEFIGFFNATFDTANNQKLIQQMSKAEKLTFEVDATNIEWNNYFKEIHIPGLRRHIINGTGTTTSTRTSSI